MSYRLEYSDIISEFKRTNPGMADNIADHYPSGWFEAVIKLVSGAAFRYDYFTKTLTPIRYRSAGEPVSSEIDWRRHFAARLRRRMIIRGITQAELAELSGIPYSSINKYMNGRATPSGYNIDRLCYALQCPASELVNI